MQEILKDLSQKEGGNKQVMGKQSNTETQKQSSVIDQLMKLVAEGEAKVKALEEQIGQLTHRVCRKN